ncbi:hypothetical protein UlMin_010733 [Ulmus minor]
MSSPNICSSSFSFWSTITYQRHDVFLSFRGEDTRHGLTKELHQALVKDGIPTFKDDINLEKGQQISPELLKAIQISRVAIIIFSKNYANSGWCHDELVKILECKREDGQFCLPVFFDVDQEGVFQQKGSFGEAFGVQEKRSGLENKIEKWRAALREASTSSRSDLRDVPQGQRSKFIKEIINQISCRRQDAHMSLHLQLEIDDGKKYLNLSKEYLDLFLSVISDDVHIIGIYGKRDSEKTNIAKAVYNQNFLRFEGSSFLANVSATADQPNGLVSLQERLLSDILMDDDLHIEDVTKGINMIQTELGSRRVLIVLDDLDKLDQLNALARRRNWFGPGSKIIITGDANLLSVLESDDVYGPQGILVIKDKYTQNRKTIKDLEGLIQKLHFQAEKRVRILEAEIEKERKKNAFLDQKIAVVRRDPEPVLTPNVLTTTRDIIAWSGRGIRYCIAPDNSNDKWLDPELKNEIRNFEIFLSEEEGK